MNLATFRTRVSGAIGMSQSNTAELALIDGWVNEGIVEFLRRTKMHTRMASLSLTANQFSYTLDTDILSFKDVWIDPASGESQMLSPVDSSDILRERTLSVPSWPTTVYALDGQNVLMLHPAPTSSSDTLHILYVPRPTALSLTSESPSATANGGIPDEFHHYIESYAKWKAADYVDDQSSGNGQVYRDEFLGGIVEAMKATTLKGGVRLAGASWGRRGNKMWPTTPGTDLGY